MAEDKKAFVAYVDWESQFDLLSDDEAGKLIKHIFAYVNDRNPQFDANERLLIMAFEPIKKQLKRDLKKYELIKQKRSEAGKKGGQKSGEVRQQNEANEANASFVKQNEANEAVTVIVKDIVKDTVIVTDTVTEREINNIEPHTQNFSIYSKQPIEFLKKNCSGHQNWLTAICKKNSLTFEKVLEWLDSFELHLLGKGISEEHESEFKRYFNSWVTSEIRQGRTPKVIPKVAAEQKTHEQIAMDVIQKKYGNIT